MVTTDDIKRRAAKGWAVYVAGQYGADTDWPLATMHPKTQALWLEVAKAMLEEARTK